MTNLYGTATEAGSSPFFVIPNERKSLSSRGAQYFCHPELSDREASPEGGRDLGVTPFCHPEERSDEGSCRWFFGCSNPRSSPSPGMKIRSVILRSAETKDLAVVLDSLYPALPLLRLPPAENGKFVRDPAVLHEVHPVVEVAGGADVVGYDFHPVSEGEPFVRLLTVDQPVLVIEFKLILRPSKPFSTVGLSAADSPPGEGCRGLHPRVEDHPCPPWACSSPLPAQPRRRCRNSPPPRSWAASIRT